MWTPISGSTEELVILHLNIENLALHGIEVRVEKASNGKSYPHVYGATPSMIEYSTR